MVVSRGRHDRPRGMAGRNEFHGGGRCRLEERVSHHFEVVFVRKMLTTATFFLIRQVKLGRSKEGNGQKEATCGSAVAYLQEVGVSAFLVIGVGGGGVSDGSVSSRAGDLAISRLVFCARSVDGHAVHPRGGRFGTTGGGGADTEAPSSRRFHAQ